MVHSGQCSERRLSKDLIASKPEFADITTTLSTETY